MLDVPDPLSVLGVPVTPFASLQAAVRCARDRIAARSKTFCVAINPEKIHRAHADPLLAQAISASHFRICDGVGVTLALRLLHGHAVSRCTGVDLFIELARVAETENWKIFLLGSTAESNKGARQKLIELFPKLEIAGWQDGYFNDSAEVVSRINSSGADLLFVAMGSPRQELWIAEHLQTLHAPLCMGVGGSLDVLSGKCRRAPYLFRGTGTEWLFRLLAQPQRIRRQLVLPLFAKQVLSEKLFPRHPERKQPRRVT